MSIRDDQRLTRLDETRVRVENPYGVDATLFASDDVPVEPAAVTELVEMLELAETAARWATADPGLFGQEPSVEKVAVTPDFHKARGIPVGTVMATRGFSVPQAIGNDINCGMRLHLTTLDADDVVDRLDDLETELRRRCFEGGRDIALTGTQREALLTGGMAAMLDATPRELDGGIWRAVRDHPEAAALGMIDAGGSLAARTVVPGLRDWVGELGRLSRDSQIGSLGGGNHFLEIQRVAEILDGGTAHAWGVLPGKVVVMVHSGSLALGHVCGGVARDALHALHPQSIRHPPNGIFLLPEAAESGLVWDALHNAANFAFGNRFFLALVSIGALDALGLHTSFPLLYDAPHNFVWREEDPADGTVFVHRKGACPARGLESMADGPFRYYGEPVLVPGSMGASSFLLAGLGNPDALESASHGAGRRLSRGQALRVDDRELERFLAEFRVVTPLDLRRPEVKLRRDVVERKLDELKQEAPFAYKGIGPVIETLRKATIARPVARLEPLLTVKG